ncbi:unnamed protein product [Prunus armeniaca]
MGVAAPHVAATWCQVAGVGLCLDRGGNIDLGVFCNKCNKFSWLLRGLGISLGLSMVMHTQDLIFCQQNHYQLGCLCLNLVQQQDDLFKVEVGQFVQTSLA